ncbi:cytochrome B [Oxalobacteraceae bacterium OM1]|nr:cytochrome B [Oxalobacteraceae bacterium OM1]
MIVVWDRLVRLVHWSVALLVLGNFLNEDGATWHRYAGYAAAALVGIRLLRGFLGRGYAGFAQWWPGLGELRDYLCALLAGRAPHPVGINPAGAVMAATMWLLILALAITGWMMGLDAFWGEEWLEQVHEVIAYALLTCVTVHVSAVIFMSVVHRENIARAMITGKKRSPEKGTPDKIRQP